MNLAKGLLDSHPTSTATKQCPAARPREDRHPAAEVTAPAPATTPEPWPPAAPHLPDTKDPLRAWWPPAPSAASIPPAPHVPTEFCHPQQTPSVIPHRTPPSPSTFAKGPPTQTRCRQPSNPEFLALCIHPDTPAVARTDALTATQERPQTPPSGPMSHIRSDVVIFSGTHTFDADTPQRPPPHIRTEGDMPPCLLGLSKDPPKLRSKRICYFTGGGGRPGLKKASYESLLHRLLAPHVQAIPLRKAEGIALQPNNRVT